MYIWSLYILNGVSIASLLLSMFYGYTIQTGLISYTLIFLLTFTLILFRIDSGFGPSKFNIFDVLIIAYILCNLLTILNVVILRNDPIVYLKGISYTLFPISGYFFLSFSTFKDPKKNINHFLATFCILTALAIVIGLYLYFWVPQYYVRYIMNILPEITEERNVFLARLYSYMSTPTVMGNISVLCLIIAVYLFKQKKFKITFPIIFVLFLSGTIFSFARSAWIAAVFGIVIIWHMINFKNKFFVISCILILSIILCITKWPFSFEYSKHTRAFIEKIYRIPSSYGERSNQVQYAVNIIDKNPFGIGLGQSGHKSGKNRNDRIGVFDNNFLRVFCETGILGFVLLVFIIIVCFLTLFKMAIDSKAERPLCILMIGVLSIFVFQSTGSNILDYLYSSHIFWSFVGIVSFLAKKKWRLRRYKYFYQYCDSHRC